MNSSFNATVLAIVEVAERLEDQAEQLAGEIEALSGLGIHSAREGLNTGADDLNRLVGGKVDEIIEALAGAGERLQQTSKNLIMVAQTYRRIDIQVASGLDTIHR